MRQTLFCLLVVVSACKKEEKAAPAAEPAKTEAAKPTEPAPTEAKPAVAAPAPTSGVKLAAGEAKFGCVGWSEKAKAAACVTGEMGTSGDEVVLSFTGGAASVKLGAKIDDASLAAANSALADFAAFDKPATELAGDGKAVDVGGVSLKHTVKVLDKGGPSIAPTEDHRVIATCAGKDTEVYKVSEEGRQIDNVMYRAVPGGTLVEITTNLGREGEYSKGFEAKLVDASCTVK